MTKSALMICICLFLAGAVQARECTDEAATFGKYQVVNKGMLDLTFAGKMNKQVGDDIGAQAKIAQKYADDGEYQKSCDVYDALIAKYGFKTFEESHYEAHPEKREPEKKESPGAASASASAVDS